MIEIQLIAQACLADVRAGHNLTKVLAERVQANTREGDGAAIRNSVYGACRHLGFLMFALDFLAKRRPAGVENLILVAVYQIEHTRAANHAVVNAAVDVTKRLGHEKLAGLVNALLRNYLRKRDAIKGAAALDETATLQHPPWWIKKIRDQLGHYGDESLGQALLHPNLTLRVNVRKLVVDDFLETLEREGMRCRVRATQGRHKAVILDEPVHVKKIPGFTDGLVSVQDMGAQSTAIRFDLQDGQRVLDACAAPGGKTTHILELADVELMALDKDKERLGRVRDNLSRLNLSCKLKVADASDVASWWDGRLFDRILVDAPCSASGVTRRHPDVKWSRKEGDIVQFAIQQRSLLSSLWKLLDRGGKLLYSTCSIFREENQDQVRWFLSKFTDAALSPGYGDDGHLMLPGEDNDGFFHALFEKI